MSKVKKLKEEVENSYINYETGESINFDDLVKMLKSCETHDRVKKQKEGLIKLRNQRGRKIIDGRLYKMDFIFEYDKNLELTPDAYYCYGRLKDNLVPDNSCRCHIEEVNSISTLSKFIKLSRVRTTNALKELRNKKLVAITKTGNYSEFYINPIYCRFGTRVQEKAIELFELDINMFEKI